MGIAERIEIPENVEELKQLVQSQAEAYEVLSTQHEELSTQHEELSTEHNDLATEYNDLTASYTDLTVSFNQKNDEYERKAHDYLVLNEKYEILRKAYFGRSSEKWSVDEKLQACLFNEAEIASDSIEGEPNACVDTITYTVTKKARGKREPIPESVPREEIIHDIPDEEKVTRGDPGRGRTRDRARRWDTRRCTPNRECTRWREPAAALYIVGDSDVHGVHTHTDATAGEKSARILPPVPG